MRKSNFYKTKRILALLLLTFGAITSTIGNHFLITGLNRNGYNNNVKSEVLGDDEKFDEPLPRSAEPQDFNGIGEQINITLHQSLIDTATKQFSNLDVSNSFTEPFPLFAGYETSFVNISINNINAPNKTLNLELATSSSDQISTDLFAYSFTIRNTCIIQNFSIYLSESGGSGGSVDIKILIFNATYDSIDSRIEPHTNTGLIDITQSVPDEHTGQWYNFTLNKVLDAANTYNNTFFIYFYQNTNFNFARGYYHYQTGTTTDNYLVYRDSGAGWQALARDISSQVIVGLNDNTPRPTEINLKVNGTLVNNLGIGNQGFYSSTQKFSSADGNIDFEVTADWWEVSCDIIRVEINFTKIDLKANSIFKILSSSDNVQWNVSAVGGLNYFDSRITDFNTINFTIPKTWLSNSIKVFNDTSEWLSADINKDFTKNGYRYVQVLNAGNGSNWYLLANSTNLLSSINTYVSGIQRQIVNFSNNVEFRGTFSEVISNGVLNISVYSPILREMNHTNVLDISTGAPNTVFSVSTWDISVDARDYGVFKAQMIWNNNTAAGFLDYFFTIVADTEFTVLDPPGGRIYKSGESFEISIQYRDIIKPEGLSDATIEYSLNGTYKSKNVAYLGSGIYNITIYVDDPDFTKFGYITIPIRASKQFYVNLTTSFMFHRQITTIITPGNSADLGDVIRGQNVSYTFNYADTLTNPITEASWSVVGSSYGFDSFLKNEGGGGYTMHLDTDNVNVAGSPYFFTFEIYSIGNETQIIQLRVNVQIITTRIESTSWIPNIPRNSGLNQTFQFYFNDTTNDQGIQNLISSDIIVRNNATGSIWTPGWNLINPLNDGWYILNISLANRNAGWYTLQVNASKFPNYDYDISYLTFYIRGNFSLINFKSYSDPGGILDPTGPGYNFTIFEGSNTIIEFNVTDTENNDHLVSTLGDSYIVRYRNLNTGTRGLIASSFQIVTQNHQGSLTTSNPALTIGNYAINITMSKLNYENVTFTYYLTVKGKFQANLTLFRPTSVDAGRQFEIVIKAEYFNGTVWLPIVNSSLTVTPYYNNIAGTPLGPYTTNSTGERSFIILTNIDTRTLNLTILLTSGYYHQEYSVEISDIVIIPPPGITDFLPYIIIGAVILVGIAGSVAVYKGIVTPRKREKARILSEVKTVFDDAINLEHIVVLYKETGTCIFFKSYGSEQIDPELIGGFLTAVSSFGKEMVAQEALNEISYGDKMLLLADGQYIRVALVLSKKASLILRRNLKQFIDAFEKTYADVLPSWRGQLMHFRNAGQIVDDILSTSIILPHQITYDYSGVKDLKNPHSREVLKIAHSCCEETERQFFFVATLLKEASEKTNKDTAEIFMGVKELRDKKMLVPIEISSLEVQPISQQEINLINQRISQLTTLSSEERQSLVNNLAQMGPAEREAYLSSITEKQKIVSAPIMSKVGTIEIASKKQARNGTKELFNRANKAKSKKNYQKAIELYQEAAMIASNWELSKEFIKLEEIVRKTRIVELTAKKKELENEAKLFIKKKNYQEVAQKYKYASKLASEIFKLGDTNMTKEVKRLTNKANEYEKLK